MMWIQIHVNGLRGTNPWDVENRNRFSNQIVRYQCTMVVLRSIPFVGKAMLLQNEWWVCICQGIISLLLLMNCSSYLAFV